MMSSLTVTPFSCACGTGSFQQGWRESRPWSVSPADPAFALRWPIGGTFRAQGPSSWCYRGGMVATAIWTGRGSCRPTIPPEKVRSRLERGPGDVDHHELRWSMVPRPRRVRVQVGEFGSGIAVGRRLASTTVSYTESRRGREEFLRETGAGSSLPEEWRGSAFEAWSFPKSREEIRTVLRPGADVGDLNP